MSLTEASEVSALLKNMEAPEPLITWAESHSFEDAWDACPDAVGQVWLWGAASLSLNEGVMVVLDAVRQSLDAIQPARSIVEHVLSVAARCVQRTATRADCEQAADEAEQAARDAKATFRDGMPDGYSSIVRAAAWVARAAEGLMTARLRAEASRMQQAQQTASYLGAGVNILIDQEPPIRLDAERIPSDAFHAELVYVVAALAEAMTHLVEARESLGQPDVNAALRDHIRAAA